MSSKRRVLVCCAASLMFGCSVSSPGGEAVAQALQAEFGKVVRVDHVRRTNGIEFPGGNGAPHQYAVEYEATLVPSGPVTFRIASALESAFSSMGARGTKNRINVKEVVQGHQPDPEGLNVLFDIGTQLWRTDESHPATVVGSVRFIKTDNGWQKATVETYLAESLAESLSIAKALVGRWEDGGSCLSIVPMRVANTFSFTVKGWYCEAGQPASGISATLTGTELKGNDGQLIVRVRSKDEVMATFRYPPPNQDHLIQDSILKKVGR